MAVITEGISIIVPVEVIERKYAGGMAAYANDCPNNTFCADEHLARIGFMVPDDARRFVQGLEARGFVPHDGRGFVDLAIVDQMRGPTANCSWLIWGRDEKGIAAAWIPDEKPEQLAVPKGWTFEGSFSQQSNFVSHEEAAKQLEWVRRDGDVDVYRDIQTGKEVFVGRTTS